MATATTNDRVARSILKAAGKFGFKTFEENAVKTFCFLCAGFSIIATVGIVFILVSEAIPFFGQTSVLDFLTGMRWSPAGAEPQFGILPLLTGTLMITVGSGLVSIPLGLFVGIYLAEYAHFQGSPGA